MEVDTELLLKDVTRVLTAGTVLVCVLLAVAFGVVGAPVAALVFVLLALYAVPPVRARVADYHAAADARLVVVGVLVVGGFTGALVGAMSTPESPSLDAAPEQVPDPSPTAGDRAGRPAASPTTPSSTSTPTPSPTETDGVAGGTETESATATPTATPTPTVAPTPTATRTRRATATRTATAGEGTAGTPASTATATPAATTTATPTPTDDGGLIRVQVVHVVDGDTIDVEYPNGTADTVRLLGIDAPEVHARNAPDEWEGVPETRAGTRCLREAGHRATDRVRSALAGETVTLRFDETQGRRGYYGRLLAYVYHNSTLVNRHLVARGNARVHDSAFERQDRFAAAERTARNRSVGAWRCRNSERSTGTPAGDGGADDAPWPFSVLELLVDDPSGDRTGGA